MFCYYSQEDGPVNIGMKLLSSLQSAVSKVNSLRFLKNKEFNLSLLKLDTIKSFYTYIGSLTTPPCTENVRWIVASEVFSVDQSSVSYSGVQTRDRYIIIQISFEFPYRSMRSEK